MIFEFLLESGDYMIKSTIISILKQNLPELQREYKINFLKLFGSYSKNQQNPDSDVDILVDFNEVINLIQFIKLKNALSEMLNMNVDLVMENALKKRIKNKILKEAESI